MAAIVKIEKNIYASEGAEKGNKQGIIEACVRLTAQEKALCPVDLGPLRNSIMWEVGEETGGFNKSSGEQAPSDQKLDVKESTRKNKVVGYSGTNSDHWYIEFGTRYMAAKPFMRPAKEIVLDGGKALEIAKKYMQDEMVNAYRRKKTTSKVIKNG